MNKFRSEIILKVEKNHSIIIITSLILIFLIQVFSLYTKPLPTHAGISEDQIILFSWISLVISDLIVIFIGYITYKISVSIINVRLQLSQKIELKSDLEYSKKNILVIFFIGSLFTTLTSTFLSMNTLLSNLFNMTLVGGLYLFFYFDKKIVYSTLLIILVVSSISSAILG